MEMSFVELTACGIMAIPLSQWTVFPILLHLLTLKLHIQISFLHLLLVGNQVEHYLEII